MKKNLLLPLALLLPLTAMAHAQHGLAEGFGSGFLHPISGLDHMAAMMAVGLWGAIIGRPALWVLPLTFPVVMALGGALGIAGIPLPAVESIIALSGLVLGVMVALAVRPPQWLAYTLVAVFAVFHGHAHGTELPEAAAPITYAAGFVLATGLMHLCGILIGQLYEKPKLRWLVNTAGGLIALVGAWFLFA